MRLEPEPLLKIVRADLDARFADLERRLGNRMRPLLDDEDAQLRRLLPQLARQAAAGETAAKDDDVVRVAGRRAGHERCLTAWRSRRRERRSFSYARYYQPIMSVRDVIIVG